MTDEDQLLRLIQDGEFLLVAEEMRERLGADFFDFLRHIFIDSKPKPTKAHELLIKIHFAAALTSNYDTLLESAYVLAEGIMPPTFTQENYQELAAALREEKFYVLKLHGHIHNFETIILSRNDFLNVIFNNKPYRDYLRTLFATKTVLFLGFGLTDPELMMFLDEMQATFHGYAEKHYALMNTSSVPPIKQSRFEKDYNIKIIPYHDHSVVPKFLGELEKACRKQAPRDGLDGRIREVVFDILGEQTEDCEKLLDFWGKVSPYYIDSHKVKHDEKHIEHVLANLRRLLIPHPKLLPPEFRSELIAAAMIHSILSEPELDNLHQNPFQEKMDRLKEIASACSDDEFVKSGGTYLKLATSLLRLADFLDIRPDRLTEDARKTGSPHSPI